MPEKKHFASIISPNPLPDLAEALTTSGSVELLAPNSGIRDFMNSPGARIAEIIFVNVSELSGGPMSLQVPTAGCCTAYVVAVGDVEDAKILRMAMRAGARDFLLRPPQIKDIQDILNTAAVYMDARSAVLKNMETEQSGLPAAKPRDSRIFTFFSPKDGTGKSTILVNFGAALASSTNKTVCLVDLVLQFGDLSPMFSVKPHGTIGNLIALPTDQIADEIKSFITPVSKNMSLLAATQRPEEGELVRPHHITAILHALSQQYDFVLVDVPGAFSDVSLAALDASSTIYLLLTPNILSIRSLKSAIDVMEGPLKYPHGKLKVILNRSDSTAGIAIKDIEAIIGRHVNHLVPSDYKTVTTAVNQGTPAVQENPKSKFSRALIQMAVSEAGPAAAASHDGQRHTLAGLFRHAGQHGEKGE